ncbi:MAG: MMPL family transporter, partial [Planctomycetota bacterium]|nr:MMPL family transporter [Planctomycetota bacterium]
MRERLLKAWAKLGWNYPYSVLIVAVVTSSASVYYAATNMGLMLNRNDMLLAKENRFHKLYLDYQKEFAPRDDIVVLVEGENEEALRRTVEELAGRIRAEPALTDLFYKMDLKHIKGRELLYRDLGELVEYLDGLRRLESEIGAGDAPGGFSLARMLSPLSRAGQWREAGKRGLGREDLERLEAILENIENAIEGREGYRTPWDPEVGKRPDLGLVVPDPSSPDPEKRVPTHSYLALRRKDGLPMYTMLMRSAREDREGVPAIRRILADYRPPAGVSVGLTGEPVIEEDENAASNENMTLISILALTGILIVFAAVFREFLRPLFGVAGLLVGLCWSAAYLVLVVGHLNIVSVCFVAILMGLGI